MLIVVELYAVMTGDSRPFRDSHDRLLYGKQFCYMEFICVSGRDGHKFPVSDWLYLEGGQSETVRDV